MIEFDLYISPNFKGGTYYTTFSADSLETLKDSLKYQWNKTGFSSDTGEIFLSAKIIVNESINKLPCGYFVFYRDGELMAMLEEDSNDEINDYWISIGFESDNFGDPQIDFEKKLTLLFQL